MAERSVEQISAEELLTAASDLFGVSPEIFLRAVLYSANARGYILGALAELLLSEDLRSKGYQVLRIKEKWKGTKAHHGDFYVARQESDEWYVLESKGLKSNSEIWHKIASVDAANGGLEAWFAKKRKGELKRWWDELPPDRRKRIIDCGRFAEAKVLETHFVSGTAGRAGRQIATPRKTEFHVVSLDLFLRTGAHEFVYAATADLPGSEKYPEHLKQNYIVDMVIPGADDGPSIVSPWMRDFDGVFAGLTDPVDVAARQIDERQPGQREAEVLRGGLSELADAAEESATGDSD